MANWLCVIDDEETYNKCFENGSWGVRGKTIRILEKVKIGDRLIFYVKEKKVGGIRIVTEKYQHDKSIETIGLYPDCIKFDKTSPEKLTDISDVDFKEKFGKELSGFVRNPMHELTDEHFELFRSIIQN